MNRRPVSPRVLLGTNRGLRRNMEQRDAEIEKYRATVARQVAHWQETYRSVIEFAIAAVKTAMLINGAAAIALLTFLRNIAPNGLPSDALTQFIFAIGCFTSGVFFAVLGASFGYFAQLQYLNEASEWGQENQPRKMPWCHRLSIIMVIVAIICFVVGIFLSIYTFLPKC